MTTWTQLFHRKALPAGATLDQARDLDRLTRGERLDRISRDQANQLLMMLRAEDAARANVDWELRDQLLKDGTRKAASSLLAAASSARPRTSTGVTVSGPNAGGSALSPRKSAFDGRTASPQDLKARISQLGLDASWYQVDQCTEVARQTAKAPSIGLVLKTARATREAAERQTARAAVLEKGRIDGRVEPAEKVRQRLDALGVGYEAQAGIRDRGEPLKPPDRGPDPLAASLETRRRAERRAKQALKEKRPVDCRRMDDNVFAAYLKVRGLDRGL
jgi:hypothetical protein